MCVKNGSNTAPRKWQKEDAKRRRKQEKDWKDLF
jgi:hypothetical protein